VNCTRRQPQPALRLGSCPVFWVASIKLSSSPAVTAAMTTSITSVSLCFSPIAIAGAPYAEFQHLAPVTHDQKHAHDRYRQASDHDPKPSIINRISSRSRCAAGDRKTGVIPP
jgi:hypothetical protein